MTKDELVDKLRMAVEILTGLKVAVTEIDVSANRGRLNVGSNDTGVTFSFSQDTWPSFHLENRPGTLTALFDPGRAIVFAKSWPLMVSENDTVMCWAGTSSSDRQYTPLYLEFVRRDRERKPAA